MFRSKQLLLASSLLLMTFPAFASDETTETSGSVVPLATVGPNAMVKCPGGINVPLTTDAVQALPLQVAGTLRCGETVAVLADNEGYTARIRTQARVEGYVARMYLAESAAGTQKKQRATATAKATNGVARWEAGAPGCDQFMSHGRHVESITANGITVQVSVQDTGWKYRTNVAVFNESEGTVNVMPSIIGLDELQPRLKALATVDARRFARTSTHQVLWTSANAEPSPSAVAPQLLAERERSTASQDYMSPHMTLASARPGVFEKTETIDVRAIALKGVTLKSGEKTAGVMWFERDANARELSLRVPVADMVFDFAFAMGGKK
jgi:hypothetical protein